MSVDRTAGIIHPRFDGAADGRASNTSERKRSSAPSFELPAPREPDAPSSKARALPPARDAQQSTSLRQRDQHELEVRRDNALDRTQPTSTRARSPLADSQDSNAGDATGRASPPQAPASRTTTKLSQPNASAQRRLDAHAGAANATSDDEPDAATSTTSNAGSGRVDDPASASDAANATPSLAERMLALLSGNLISTNAASAPEATVNADGLPAGAFPGGAAQSATGTPAAQLPAAISAAISGSGPLNADASAASGVGTAALQLASTSAGATSATPSITTAAAAGPAPAAVTALPTTAAATPSSDASATLAAAVESFGAALAHAGSASKESERGTTETRTATGGIDPGALLARAPADLSATRVVQAPAITHPAHPDAGFGDELADSIVWMAEQKLGHAEIRLNPENLGPIDVRLQMDGHRISAQFQAANPDVRHALEAGMDRLRDMLGRHGMELSDSHVGNQQQDGGQRDRAAPRNTPGGGADGDDASPVTTTVRALRTRGLIDEYV